MTTTRMWAQAYEAKIYRTTRDTNGTTDYIDMGVNPAALQTASTAIQAGTGFVIESVTKLTTGGASEYFGSYDSASEQFAPGKTAANKLGMGYKTSAASTEPTATFSTDLLPYFFTSDGKIYKNNTLSLNKSAVTGNLPSEEFYYGALNLANVPSLHIVSSLLHHRIWLAVDLSEYAGGVPAAGNGWIDGKTVLYQDIPMFAGSSYVSGTTLLDQSGNDNNATTSGTAYSTINSTYQTMENGYLMCDGQGVYADTGIYPTADTILKVDMQFNTVGVNGFCGSADTANNRRFGFGVNSTTGKWQLIYGNNFADSVVDADLNRHIFMISGGKLYLDGVMIVDGSGFTFTGTSVEQLTIGCRTRLSAQDNFVNGIIYSAAINNNKWVFNSSNINSSETGVIDTGAITSRGPTSSEDTLSISSQTIDTVLSSGGSTPVTIDDINYDRETSATVRHTYNIVATGANNVTYTSTNEAAATVDANGRCTRITDGTCGIVAMSPMGGRRLDLDFSDTGGEIQDVFSSWVVGSLAEETNDAIDTRLAGGGDKEIYTTQNHSTQTYVRNASCWAVDLDLTGVSPWNTTGNATRAGTLISPRHIIFANHYPISNGATVRFVKADNTVVNMTLSSQVRVGTTDFKIGLLNADVPAGITYYKLPPTNLLTADYLPSLSTGVPALCLDKEEKASVADWCCNAYNFNSMSVPTDATRFSYYEDKITGDSGNPAFMIVDDELILLTTWYYGGAGSGPASQDLIMEINTAMTTLGGGYTSTIKDLSAYPTY